VEQFTEIAPGIVTAYNVFPTSNSIIDLIEQESQGLVSLWEPSMVIGENGEGFVNTKSRNCFVYTAPQPIKDEPMPLKESPDWLKVFVSQKLYEAFAPYYDQYKQKYNVDLENVYEDFSILRYGFGQRFRDHCDDGSALLRRVSLCYYVNDDYEGGEILFDNFGLSIKPQAKQLIIFPSNFMYTHEVMPVMRGTRYAIVQWVK